MFGIHTLAERHFPWSVYVWYGALPFATGSKNVDVVKEGKNIAIISYVTVVGLIIAFVMNNDKKSKSASYHIAQSLGLDLTAIAIGIIPILGWIINIVGVFVLL